MTDRTKTLRPAIFDLGDIKRERFAVNIDSCSIIKKEGEKKELLIKRVWEKR